MAAEIPVHVLCGLLFCGVMACQRPATNSSTSPGGAKQGLDASARLAESRGDAVEPPGNADISKLESRLAVVEGQLAAARADSRHPSGATYCGATAATKGAFFGPAGLRGYAAARARCAGIAGCDQNTVHMCTADDLIRTTQLGTPIPDGWYSTGTFGLRIGDTDDCGGWVHDNHDGAVESGPRWLGKPTASACSEARPILCCH